MAKCKMIHRRVNGWRIGDYAVFEGNGFRVVGQLENIGTNDYGHFKGYIVFSIHKKHKVGRRWDWGLYLNLTQSSRDAMQPNLGTIEQYETTLEWLPGNKV